MHVLQHIDDIALSRDLMQNYFRFGSHHIYISGLMVSPRRGT